MTTHYNRSNDRLADSNIKVVTTLDEIAGLKDPWNEIALDRPFLSWEWYNSWYQNYSHKNEPFVFIEQTAGQSIDAIAPFYKSCSSFGTTKLCLAADGKVCTDYGQLITLPKKHSYFVSKFACWFKFDRGEEHVDFVELDGLALNAQTTQELITQLHDQGFFPRIEPTTNCWSVNLTGDWESLDASFSKKHRRKTKKANDRLADAQIFDTSSRSFEYLWSNFVKLHQLRRRALGQPGCFADQRFESFLGSATCGLLERGLAEILVVECNGKPAAATLIFYDRQTAFMYQTGFNPGLSHQEPGYMLIVAAMQWAINRGLKSFDFMRGDEAYKARWNTRPNQIVRIQFQLSDNFRSNLEDRIQRSKRIVKSSLELLGL